MDEFDDVEEQNVLVKLLAQYPSERAEDAQETSYHEFIDTAPDFDISNGMIDAYGDMPGVKIRIWHLDVPPPMKARATHEAPLQVQ